MPPISAPSSRPNCASRKSGCAHRQRSSRRPGADAQHVLAAMSHDEGRSVAETLDAIYRAESRRIIATLIRLLGEFDVAEEALHDAFRAALEHWPREGVPANPRAWLVSAGRFLAFVGLWWCVWFLFLVLLGAFVVFVVL